MKRNYHIGPGAASLMLIAVILSMSVLGMLALMNARGDMNLSRRGAEMTVLAYGAGDQAERTAMALDGLLVRAAEEAADDDAYLKALAEALPAGMALEGRMLRWREDAGANRSLVCAVEVSALNEPVRFVWRERWLEANQDEELIFE